MPRLSRRSLLAGGTALAASAHLPRVASSQALAYTPFASPLVGRADLARSEDQLDVLSEPGGGSVVTRLPQDTHIRVMGERAMSSGRIHLAIRLWNAVDGFVPKELVAFDPSPGKPPSSGAATPWKPATPPAQGPFPLAESGLLGWVIAEAQVASEPAGPSIGRLSAGTPVVARAYATDTQTRVWVKTDPAGNTPGGWILADRWGPDTPDPLTASVGGVPLASHVRGTGMWFTYDVLRDTSLPHIIAAAKANGMSFLAPEVGTSRRAQ
jgi:hypothetical protein